MKRKPIEANPGDREAMADAIVRSREQEGKEPQSERAEVLADVITERQAIERERSRGFAFNECADKGLQVLIDRFGASRVAEAFVQAENAEGRSAKKLPSVLDALRILAPEASEREEVYKEMEGAADAIQAQYGTGKPLEGYEDIDPDFRPKFADEQNYRMTASALRTLDRQTVLGKAVDHVVDFKKYERIWLEGPMTFLRDADLLREPTALAERLQEQAGDLRRAAHALVENATDARGGLVEKVMEIRLLAVDAFDRAEREALIARDTARQNLHRDVNKLLAQDLTNPTVKHSVQEAIERAIAEQDRQEAETNRRLEAAAKEHRAFLLQLAQQVV